MRGEQTRRIWEYGAVPGPVRKLADDEVSVRSEEDACICVYGWDLGRASEQRETLDS